MRTISMDLHGMTAAEGRQALLRLLKQCPTDTDEIEVIHGSHGGQALLSMVRRELKHPRIDKKLLGLNNGVTILKLRH